MNTPVYSHPKILRTTNNSFGCFGKQVEVRRTSLVSRRKTSIGQTNGLTTRGESWRRVVAGGPRLPWGQEIRKVLKGLPTVGSLFPPLRLLGENMRAGHFCKVCQRGSAHPGLTSTRLRIIAPTLKASAALSEETDTYPPLGKSLNGELQNQ